MKSAAGFSACRVWRYWLLRRWSDLPLLSVIGLNPSTADEQRNDPTIKRCIGFATSWGFGGLLMLNLYGFRSTDPAGLALVSDPVGPDNDQALLDYTALTPIVLCAWGSGRGTQRGLVVRDQLVRHGRLLVSLGCTKDGSPRHPLYVKASTRPRYYAA